MARPNFDLRLAAPGEALAVSEVLQEAARWITTWRSQLWDPELLDESFAAPFIARGEMLTARTDGEIAGVMILQPEDPLFWPDRPSGEAAYIHKLAVRRAYAGMGLPAALIDHAEGLARAQDRDHLRLDCHPDLAPFYDGLGFRRVDEIEVHHPEAGRMRVARMERRIKPA
jgi:ribosomal protein S18 acetylase RimI-like enzyme